MDVVLDRNWNAVQGTARCTAGSLPVEITRALESAISVDRDPCVQVPTGLDELEQTPR
jgi:hypothetical protein